MKATINIIFLIIFTFSNLSTINAQDGLYDVRFNMNNVDCENNKTFIDIEIKAHAASQTFNLSDQNYRFSFNRAAAVPGSATIEIQHLTGFIPPLSFYDPHTLTGSIDTIVSYNVVLAGGEGVLVTTDWLTIGTISLDILDINECLNLKWHDHAPENFPPTFIGEKKGNSLYAVNEGNYTNTQVCPGPICGETLPVELVSFIGNDQDCTVTLEWITETETNNEFFQIEKSLNGKEFEIMGTVNGSGTTLNSRRYNFVDETPNPFAYYRLKQVDFDGTTATSETITVRSTCYGEDNPNAITDIYPNPVAAGDVKVKFYATEMQPAASILVTDMLGRIVLEQPTLINAGANTLSFPSERLSAGTYLVKIDFGQYFTKAQKLVKLD